MKEQYMPELYLFPKLTKDPVLNGLLAVTEGEQPPKALYRQLLKFSVYQAVTGETVREYLVRRLLSHMPDYAAAPEAAACFSEDTGTVYRLFFETDWAESFQKLGLLPIPHTQGTGPRYEVQFQADIEALVKAGNAEDLYRQVQSFINRYRNEDEAKYRAFAWNSETGSLKGIKNVHAISFAHLSGLEYQKETIRKNTRAFIEGKPANNILLVGGAGTGKSSCVKASLNEFAHAGLKLVEIKRNALHTLPELMEALACRKCKYIIYIDDLSFEQADTGYLQLKVALDGQISSKAGNILVYATSNRRHLIKETWDDRDGSDIHENDTLHEKMSLSERFGIHLFFSVLSQNEYLAVIRTILEKYGYASSEELEKQAITWAIRHNGRSGRTAEQFVLSYIGGQ